MSFADPMNNVLQLGLREGMKVGDFGAGTGHYAVAAAGIVGALGKVYAVDIQEDILARVKESAEQKGLRNVEVIWGDIEKVGGTRLKDQVLDAVIVSNALFQIEHHEGLVREIRRVLRSGGKLLIVDWAGAYSGLGPSEDLVVPEHRAEELFITAGFHKAKAFRGGPHHYALVFTAP